MYSLASMTRAYWQHTRGLRSAAACALIAVCAGGFGAVAASAKAPAQPRSTYPSANALATLGLKVTWPLTAQSSTVQPGSRLVVKVARTSFARHGAVAKLTYARVTPRGRLRTLEATRLRQGRFSVRVPRAKGASYALTLRVADLRYSSVVSTPARSLPANQTGVGSTAPTTTTPPTVTTPSGVVIPNGPQPQPPSNQPPPPCAPFAGNTNFSPNATFSATLTVDQSTAQPGGSVPYTLQNTGTGCLTSGAGYGWQDLVNGTWTNVPLVGIAWPAIAFQFPPGQTMNGSALLPASFAAGTYRLVISLAEDVSAAAPPSPSTAITLYSDLITVTQAPIAPPVTPVVAADAQ